MLSSYRIIANVQPLISRCYRLCTLFFSHSSRVDESSPYVLYKFTIRLFACTRTYIKYIILAFTCKVFISRFVRCAVVARLSTKNILIMVFLVRLDHSYAKGQCQ